ncbi:hypothetical protein R50072_21530 [Simiduia litorea]
MHSIIKAVSGMYASGQKDLNAVYRLLVVVLRRVFYCPHVRLFGGVGFHYQYVNVKMFLPWVWLVEIKFSSIFLKFFTANKNDFCVQLFHM